MSEMNNLDLTQLEEVSGGVYTGPLAPAETAALDTLIRAHKQIGTTLEELLDKMTDAKGSAESVKKCKQYVRAYWDRVQLSD